MLYQLKLIIKTEKGSLLTVLKEIPKLLSLHVIPLVWMASNYDNWECNWARFFQWPNFQKS